MQTYMIACNQASNASKGNSHYYKHDNQYHHEYCSGPEPEAGCSLKLYRLWHATAACHDYRQVYLHSLVRRSNGRLMLAVTGCQTLSAASNAFCHKHAAGMLAPLAAACSP
jgi:hypothetical protein